jgi:uncharacterized surface protein with fasciclin (FAS1) repeats
MKLYILIILAFSFAFSSCTKEEFMPAPLGESIPYQETKKTIQEALQESPYTCFTTAWRRSNMEKIVKGLNPKIALSIFIPDNKAFEALGYTIATINRTPVAVLDSLLLFHTAANQVLPEKLDPRSANYLFLTLLSNKNYIERYGAMNSEFREYLYRHYFNVEDYKTIVDGKVSGNVADIVVGSNGTLIPINKVLIRPEKDIKESLEADGRFGLYLSALALNNDFYIDNFGYPSDHLERFSSKGSFINFSSVLAPTDEAFHKAGIYSVADIEKLNSRSTPYTMEDYFTVSNYLPSDSILNNHLWRYNGVYVRNLDPSYNSAYISPSANPIYFYSNDLKNEILANYVTVYNTERWVDVYHNNLEFIRSEGQIKIKVKDSEAEPATVIESDIHTFNGVIHVVNRLLIPKGFKF